MKKNSPFHEYLTNYLVTYLPLQRGNSNNTIKSYATSFSLLFQYLQENRHIKADKVTFETLTLEVVKDFGIWLEEERKCRPKTRNLRIQAIKSFCNYVLVFHPECGALVKPLLLIKDKKVVKPLPPHLSTEELIILFRQPDTKKKRGVRDLALMNLLFETAVRVTEFINIKVCDITFSKKPVLTVLAKGGIIHSVCIPLDTEELLRKYLKIYHISLKSDNYLFTGPSNEKLTRQGINYILKKYQKKAKLDNPHLFKNFISAHGMRHSKSYELVNSGTELIYIRDFLGHSSVTTTEHYARTSPELVSNAILKFDKKHFDKRNNIYSKEKRSEMLELLDKLKR